MGIREPEINTEGILVLKDTQFHIGNVCIVTGCGNGIGRACAVAAAVNQLMVVGLDIDADAANKTQQLARQMGGQMIFLPTDLTRDAEIEAAVAESANLGTIKYLLNITGQQHIDPIETFPMAVFDQIQQVMLRAPFLLSKLTIPHMKNSPDGTGTIGFMASVDSNTCTCNNAAQNIAKLGLRALSLSISAEGRDKVRSFTVSLGFTEHTLPLKQKTEETEQRGITPVEVANIFIFNMSRHGRHLANGDLLSEGDTVKTHQ